MVISAIESDLADSDSDSGSASTGAVVVIPLLVMRRSSLWGVRSKLQKLSSQLGRLRSSRDWNGFYSPLEGLTQTLEKSGRADAVTEIRQAAIYRLWNEAMLKIPPEVEARSYMHITRLNSQNRQRAVTPHSSLATSLWENRLP
mgnify:CR=1 FL=1